MPYLKKIYLHLRKLFGCRPRVGDRVHGWTDFAVMFDGVVVEDNTGNPHFKHYIVYGTVYIDNMWRGLLVNTNDTSIVPLRCCKLGSNKRIDDLVKYRMEQGKYRLVDEIGNYATNNSK